MSSIDVHPPERINTHAGDDTGTPLKVLVNIVSRCQTPKRINIHSGDDGDDTHTRLQVLVNIIPCCPPSEKIKRQNFDDEDDTCLLYTSDAADAAEV